MNYRPLKVVLLLNNLNGGGGERAHVMLANGLADIGHDVEMIVVNKSGPCEKLLSSKVRITDLGQKRAVFALPSLIKALRDSRPDLLVSAMVIANVLAALAGLVMWRLPLIAIEHGDMNETYHFDKRKLAALIGYRLAPLIYGRFARIYCVDQSSLISVAAFTRRDDLPLSVMPNAVIGDDAEERMRVDPNHRYFLSSEPVLINVGRMSEQKNQSLLLRAFARLREIHPARLIILGDGPLRTALESERDALGLSDCVDMPGFTDPFPFLARADTFVLSSNWEALPTVVIEALFCGCKLVVTKASMGTLELVDFGRNGRIAAEKDEFSLFEEMAASISDPANRTTLKARGARYEKKIVAKLYADDFKTVVNRGLVARCQ